MKYYLIKKLVQKNGQCDYKGLNIDLIIGGTQVYPCSLKEDNRCILCSEEDIPSKIDLIQISENEYLNIKDDIENKNISLGFKNEETLEEKVSKLEEQNRKLENTILELKEVI